MCLSVYKARDRGLKRELPRIRCSCGAEILMVPDVKLMSEAIEAHLKTHCNKMNSSMNCEVELDRIRDDLIAQVFQKSIEQEK